MRTTTLAFFVNLLFFVAPAPFPTIILINGTPHLVNLDDEGHILEIIQTVPYYFESDLTHEEIMDGLLKQKNQDQKSFYASNEDRFIAPEEVDILETAEFIRFISGKALLDRVAVNRIRQISNDYANGGVSNINLNIIYENTTISELLTDNRLASVRDLLIAFGVNEYDISTQKDLRENLNSNPFVRINYKIDQR